MRKNTASFILSLGAALVLTFLIKEVQFSDSQVYVLFLLFFSIGAVAHRGYPTVFRRTVHSGIFGLFSWQPAI